MFEKIDKTEDSFGPSKILLTGGTGFFGRSILRELLVDRSLFNVGPSVLVVTRSPETFRSNYPEFSNLAWLEFHRGDVLEYSSLPADGEFSHILHAATESTVGPSLPSLQRYDEIVDGTRNILDYAVKSKVKRVLLASSGGVYGPQPDSLEKIPENYLGIPDPLDPSSAYSMGKRAAEHLCSLFNERFGLEAVIARCFAFVGKDLPLNAHFAIGNFIYDALHATEINVSGDGSPLRSYMNQADLARWLLRILDAGVAGQAYNVGSDQAIKIADLAYLVRDTLSPSKKVVFANAANDFKGRNVYIPDISKAQTEMNLSLEVSLLDSLREHRRC